MLRKEDRRYASGFARRLLNTLLSEKSLGINLVQLEHQS